MRADGAFAAVAATLSAVGLAACGGSSAGAPEATAAKLETVRGQQRIVLSRQAVERIGLRTTAVRSADGRGGTEAIPFSALLYTAAGKPFTYVQVGPYAYARKTVRVAHLTSGEAFLSSGPPPGTTVVRLGGEELNGTETGVQEPE